MNDLDKQLEKLGEEWGSVYMAYYPEWPENPFIVRNKTDEGLPIGSELKEFRGDTFSEAVSKAIKGCVNDE